MRPFLFVAVFAPALFQPEAPRAVGPAAEGTTVTTGQLVRPIGKTVEFAGRPVDLAVSPDGRTVYAKDNRGLVVIDAAAWTVRQEIGFGDKGGSMTGLVVSPDGARVWASDADRFVHELAVGADGKLAKAREFTLPGPKGGKDPAHPAGLALTPDGSRLLVCTSRRNQLDLVILADGTVAPPIDVGIAPFDVVVAPDGSRAYVSCWGGRRPAEGDATAPSSGTPVKVDERGIAASGGVAVVDLVKGEMVAWVETGLSASGLCLTPDGRTLYCTNANSDTVSVIDAAAASVKASVVVRPGADLPFGSMPNAATLSPDGGRLYVACAGNNALAVVDLAAPGLPVAGWIPTGWYPGAVVAAGERVYVANIKGVGSRTARKDGAFNSRRHRGSVQAFEAPAAGDLTGLTARVKEDGRIPQVLRALERREKAEAVKPVPVPAKPGDPSTIEHVVYIIKENRTYDQVFGDLAEGPTPRGNGRPGLCIYGREVTPNHHALTERFVLLDNWYCNGVLSADGHSWATEGNSTPYLERSFGGFTRSYTYGDDPLTYSASGFIWDHVLAAGLTVRNFGELHEAKVLPPAGSSAKWAGVWEDRKSGQNQYRFGGAIGIDNLRRHSELDFPGWNLDIPDQVRADRFIASLGAMETSGEMPNFVMIHLPQDHTMGVTEGGPTPRACVADNDLALGRIVEALSRSKFWPKLAVFCVEDDPQDGWDHVDGHRSVCLLASPWVKRGAVVSEFANQTSVVHTMERILGLTAQNQLYAQAPLMTGCFSESPDFSPYTAVPARLALDELSPPKKKAEPAKPGDGQAPPSQKAGEPAAPATPPKLSLADLYDITARQDLRRPDRVSDHEFNLVLWHASMGMEAEYPEEWAGAHGTGLPRLGLKLDPDAGGEDEDDDDE